MLEAASSSPAKLAQESLLFPNPVQASGLSGENLCVYLPKAHMPMS